MRHCERLAIRPRALLIAGPTATGKSALALRCAERFGGIVINADALQVYRDLRVLTARPSVADESRMPHALFGTVDGATAYSVDRWLDAMQTELVDASRRDLLPIIVGGTGLYLKALTQGLSAIPTVPPALRDEVRRWARNRPAVEIHRELARLDPRMAERLRRSDAQRLTRALEVVRATGRSLAEWQGVQQPALLPLEECRAFTITSARADTARRIETRFTAMVRAGAIDEAEALRARQLDPALPIMRSLGLRPLLALLSGDHTLDAACAAAMLETRRYVKRQETFFRTQLAAFSAAPIETLEEEIGAAFPGRRSV